MGVIIAMVDHCFYIMYNIPALDEKTLVLFAVRNGLITHESSMSNLQGERVCNQVISFHTDILCDSGVLCYRLVEM